MDMKTSNSYLIREIKYHNMLAISGNYWGRIVTEFVRDQTTQNRCICNSEEFKYDFLNNKDKRKKLENLLNAKFLKVDYSKEKVEIKFKTVYLAFINYTMQLLMNIAMCSCIVLPIFLFPLGLSKNTLFAAQPKSFVSGKFIVSEQLIQNELVPFLQPPRIAPPSAPTGLRISN